MIIIRYVLYFIVSNTMTQITESVDQLLNGKNFAYVSTLMKDGSPQVIPTWVDIEKDGSSILINAAEGRIKHKNVSRDPRIAISIADQSNPYNMVSIRGKVIEQITKGADEHTDTLAKKNLGMDKYPYRLANEKRVILKKKPEKVYHQQPPK